MVNGRWLLALLFTSVISLLGLAAYQELITLGGSKRSLVNARLQKIISLFNLTPLPIRRYEADPKFLLGRALFFDPILSGNRDISCATCHLLKHGLSDGLARSIGTHGEGLGLDRHFVTDQQIHPRNSLDLWNRDNDAVRAFFWDGRVEVLDPDKRIFRSPLENALPIGFQNAMAVQSIFPIVTPDEMLGNYGEYSPSSLPEEHRYKLNDLVVSKSFPNETARIQSAHRQILHRLLGLDEAATEWQIQYRKAFQSAYPKKTFKDISIADLGNAIAHFEELAFAATDSAWDKYLAGDTDAITDSVKAGAITFYGKGRCAACHTGALFSDFSYHNIGIYSTINMEGEIVNDYGRWFTTKLAKDRYRFRTPPLRNVMKSSPYFHDGSTSDLESALSRHLNPIEHASEYLPDGSFAMEKDQIESISPVLMPKINLTHEEIGSVISFLKALESRSRELSQIVPHSVPSGLPIVYR